MEPRQPDADAPSTPAGSGASGDGEASGERSSFSLEGREAIRFEADGFHHPTAASGSKRVFTRFAALTHVATSPRALWIGAEDSVYVLPRGSFVASDDPERLVQALLSRVAQLPEGTAQLERMSAVEATARLDEREIATWAFAALCVLVYLAQLFHTPWLERVSYFNGAMATQGDWWRYITANVFHSYLVHLVLNVAGLVAVGTLVEHALGTARTLFVMIVSGVVAAMVVSGLATSVPVVGASGVVSGLVGALLWLELRMTDQLPAWWRVPRRVLYWVIGISAVLSLLPAIAGAAHLGGFLGGVIAVRLVIDRGLGSRASEGWIRGAATAGVVLTAASMATATYHASSADSFLERYGGRVLMTYRLTPYDANEWAWLIATTPDASAEMLENGRQLAEQAVQATDRSEPAILDTLAELHFQLGNPEAAQILIDEAIELEPTNTYYRGQRARFEAGNPDAPLPPANEADGILDLTV